MIELIIICCLLATCIPIVTVAWFVIFKELRNWYKELKSQENNKIM